MPRLNSGMSGFTPVNQLRLTNVAIVRLRKHGSRFEIAAFKNKVMSWRSKIEKDIDEVLQTHQVFTNVSKGELAKHADLIAAFGTDNQEEICLEILAKGELQVSKEEREQASDSTFKEIAAIVSDKCVNPDTQRPYSITQIERAMKDIHFSIKPTKSVKQQALEVIKSLKETIAIERAAMTLRIRLPLKDKKVKESMAPFVASIQSQEVTDDCIDMTCIVDPGCYRQLEEHLREHTRGKAAIDIVAIKNIAEGDQAI
eukprot:m.382561 g.382561  ORF g.382561 m.382561 type:complete len:257 (+) comp56250_c0_seq7:61-831(+)